MYDRGALGLSQPGTIASGARFLGIGRSPGPCGACAIGVRYYSELILALMRRNPILLDHFRAYLRGYPY